MLVPNVFGSRRNHWIDIREHAIVIDGLIIDAHGLLVRLGGSVAYRVCPTRHPTFSHERPQSPLVRSVFIDSTQTRPIIIMHQVQ